MTVLYQCDNCKGIMRSPGWTATDGHITPRGWLTNTVHHFHACCPECADKIDKGTSVATGKGTVSVRSHLRVIEKDH